MSLELLLRGLSGRSWMGVNKSETIRPYSDALGLFMVHVSADTEVAKLAGNLPGSRGLEANL